MIMMMLPKHMKLVWREKQNCDMKISSSLAFYMQSAVPHQVQSLFENTGGLGLIKRVPFVLLKCEY